MAVTQSISKTISHTKGGKSLKKIGIYNPYLVTKGGGEKVCLAMAEYLAKQSDTKVHLVCHGDIDLRDLGGYFNLDLSNVTLDILNSNRVLEKIIHRLPAPKGIKNLFSEAILIRKMRKQKYDVFINNCYQSNLPNVGRKGIYMCMFPQKIAAKNEKNTPTVKKIYRSVLYGSYKYFIGRGKHPVFSYDIITANSKYTQSYIKKYWGVDSSIIYPICENMYDRKVSKQKYILNVGRFFGREHNAHHKRQDVILDSFIKDKSAINAGWELHFAGSVAEDSGSLKYVLGLMQQAHGYPVQFHLNCSFKDLKKLYNESSIYCHATGFGSDPEEHPDRQEHFGISTVEAMSTGSTPCVINTAGQKEVIKDGVNGYLWSTEKELSIKINKLTTKQLDRQELRDYAGKYSKKAFENSLEHLLDKVS